MSSIFIQPRETQRLTETIDIRSDFSRLLPTVLLQKPLDQPKDANQLPANNFALAGIKVRGTGFATGSKRVDNADLEKQGYDSEWIRQRTGILSRFHVAPHESTGDMALRASEMCLKNANLQAEEIDLVIVGTITPDHFAPGTANIIQAKLGCRGAAFDLNAACSGFIFSLITASQFLATGCFRRALVIGADAVTTLTNPDDKKTFPLFGDGAGAVIIEKVNQVSESNLNHQRNFNLPSGNPASSALHGTSERLPGVLAFRLASEGELGQALLIPGGGSRMPFSQQTLDEKQNFLVMDGRTVFKWAVRLIPEIVGEMLFHSGLSLDEIDLFIPHQANQRIIDAAVETLNIDRRKVFVNLEKYGNTSAASIPIALHEAVEQGRIKAGSHVLMVGFGAGLAWGACLMRW